MEARAMVIQWDNILKVRDNSCSITIVMPNEITFQNEVKIRHFQRNKNERRNFQKILTEETSKECTSEKRENDPRRKI